VVHYVAFKIKGRVIDETGEGLIGANILVKGTGKGTTADADGNFELEVPNAQAVLVISFVGYDKQEITVGTQTFINVSLKPQKALEEVVVVGFAVQKKISVTGAVSSVSTKELIQSPVANLSNSLVGRMAGLFAVQGSGEPGSDASTLRIRGVSTFAGGTSSNPLIMVDGIEVSNYNNIDPNEIESVTILKDASATAVYGIRGANGVLIITTKRGTVGKPQLSYSSNVAITGFTDLRKGMDSYTYAKSFNEGLKYDAYVSGAVYKPQFSDEDIEKYKTGSDPTFYPSTDWYSQVLKPYTTQTQHNLNINGGTEKVKYFISAGFFNQGGQYNESSLKSEFKANKNYKRYNFRSNFNFDVTKRLKVAIDIASQTEALSGSNASTVNVIENLSRATPISSPGVLDGKIVDIVGVASPVHPIAALYSEGYKRQYRNYLQGSIRLEHKLDFLLDGLVAHGVVNYQNNNTEDIVNRKELIRYNIYKLPNNSVNFIPQTQEQPFTYNSSIGKNRREYVEFGLNYKKTFGAHAVTALVNYNQTKNFNPDLQFLIPNAYQGVVGRTTYGYKDKYLAEFSCGYNGTENFAPGKRFGFFPAVSLGWVVSEEKFFPKTNFITFFKIRGSSGEVGNDKIGGDRFLYRPSAFTQQTNGYYFGEVGSTYLGYTRLIEGKLGNPDVTWEKAVKQNVGVELTMFNDKLSITADYFVDNRDNILANLGTVPLLFGATLPTYNLGKMKNSGFDGDFTFRSKIGKLKYFVKGNFTYAHNVIQFQDEVTKPYDYQYRTGQRLGQYFGLVADGLYQNWEEVNDANRPISAWNNNKIQPGDIRYKDINGDGRIDVNDEVPIGYSNFPEKVFGVSLGGNLLGFDFSVLFQGATNVSMAYNRRQIRGFAENTGAVEYLVNSWSPERVANGDPIWFPHLSIGDVVQKHNYVQSSFWVVDASYLRIKNVEIGYNFNEKRLAKYRIGGIRIYANANNVFTWSKLFPGIDPENDPGRNNEEPYPLTRTANIGFNVKF
jgi:TonB-linked SusC/RagA family outer membrane protein